MLNKFKSHLQQAPSKKPLILLSILLLLMLVLIGLRIFAYLKIRKETNVNLLPLVSVAKAEAYEKQDKILLPGTLLAWHETPIYARTNGYIKNWYVDIGSKIKKGDLLAFIETPELDAQLRQAKADLEVAIAQNKLAQSTAKRWLYLRQSDSVSQQATDEKVDTAKALAATVISQRANRDHLQQLVDFQRVLAPFDGIISDRRTDIGSLINIGSSPSEQQPLFRIVQVNPLRLYIKIPQAYSSRIKPNVHITLQVPEHPGETFSASLLATANAIDPNTRTLLAQFVVKNPTEVLLPGAYTAVKLTVPNVANALRLPINALIFRKEGLQVATISKDNKIILKKIKIHKDFGNYVVVTDGVKLDEPIVVNPSDTIYAGQEVRITTTKVPV